MDELCALSGVNKASIYYHFQDKVNLYEVVVTGLFESVVNQVIEAVAQQISPEQKLQAFIASFAHATYANKKMPAILMREIAKGGQALPIPARQQMQKMLEQLRGILTLGQVQGRFRQVDLLTTHFMIIGSLCFYTTSEPMRLAIESAEKLDPNVEEAIAEIYQLILNAVALTN